MPPQGGMRQLLLGPRLTPGPRLACGPRRYLRATPSFWATPDPAGTDFSACGAVPPGRSPQQTGRMTTPLRRSGCPCGFHPPDRRVGVRGRQAASHLNPKSTGAEPATAQQSPSLTRCSATPTRWKSACRTSDTSWDTSRIVTGRLLVLASPREADWDSTLPGSPRRVGQE